MKRVEGENLLAITGEVLREHGFPPILAGPVAQRVLAIYEERFGFVEQMTLDDEQAYRRMRPPAERKHRNTDPPTSAAADRDNAVRRDSQKGALLGVLLGVTHIGATADEAYEHLAGRIPLNSLSTRVADLKRDGLIEGSGRTRRTRAGSEAEVLIPTEAARQRAREGTLWRRTRSSEDVKTPSA